MIKFEHNMLVLNNAFSREDVEEINAFAEHVRNQERERIIEVWYREMACDCEDPMRHLLSRIKGDS